jgi:hypothetical protein
MKPELFQKISLLRDVPDSNLRMGDVATLIDFVPHPSGGEEGAVLEIFNVLGESFAVVTVPVSAIASLRADQVPAVRTLTPQTR